MSAGRAPTPETAPDRPRGLEPRFVSYSANFEDVILQRLFGARERGFYVDVGAGHPVFENDTKVLYDRGWSGINVEPNPSFFDALARDRPRDSNYCLAVGDAPGEAALYVVLGTGLSTCDAALASRARGGGHRLVERRVPVRTLGSLFDEVKPAAIDLLKVDVEGWEPHVLVGNDWDRYRPSVILVEATVPESAERRPTGVGALLEGYGYRRAYFDGLNDFYVHRDFGVPPGAFDSPPNVHDRFKLRVVADLEDRVQHATQAYEAARDFARSLERELAPRRARQLGIVPSAVGPAPSAAQEAAAASAAPPHDSGHLASEAIVRLEHALDDERFERASAGQALERARGQMLEFSRALDAALVAAEERDQARRELERAGDALAQANTALGAADARAEGLAAQLRTTASHAAEREAVLAHVHAQYLSILHSRSWRLGAPARRIAQAIRSRFRRH